MASSSRAQLGAVLSNRWRLVHPIGEGPAGQVFAAEALAGGGRVAVKRLRAELASDPRVRARFFEEAGACARLVHPNIARVLEHAPPDEPIPYVVTELLDGVPLGAYTSNGGRVPPVQAVSIAQGVLAALAAAHAQGRVHGDLKPANVFLARHASGAFVVKVLDFGGAAVLDAAAGDASGRASGAASPATAAYMSPEQVAGAPDVDARADVWSAGVLLYEMLTGRAAFPAPTEYARRAVVTTTDPEPIERIDPALAALSPCVVRALKKDREARFASALEMAHALAAVDLGEAARGEASSPAMPASAARPLSRLPQVPSLFGPHETPPTNAPSAVVPLVRQRPGGTLASAADPVVPVEPVRHVGLAFVADAIGGTLPSKDGPVPAHGTRAAGKRSRSGLVAALVAAALLAGFVLGWLVARGG